MKRAEMLKIMIELGADLKVKYYNEDLLEWSHQDKNLTIVVLTMKSLKEAVQIFIKSK